MKKLSLRELICYGASALCILLMLIFLFPAWYVFQGMSIPIFKLGQFVGTSFFEVLLWIFVVLAFAVSLVSLLVSFTLKFKHSYKLVKINKIMTLINLIFPVVLVIMLFIYGGRVEQATAMPICFAVFMLLGGVAVLVANRKNKEQKQQTQTRKEANAAYDKNKLDRLIAWSKEKSFDAYEFYKKTELSEHEVVDFLANGEKAQSNSVGKYDKSLPGITFDDFCKLCKQVMYKNGRSVNVYANERNGVGADKTELGTDNCYNVMQVTVRGLIQSTAHTGVGANESAFMDDFNETRDEAADKGYDVDWNDFVAVNSDAYGAAKNADAANTYDKISSQNEQAKAFAKSIIFPLSEKFNIYRTSNVHWRKEKVGDAKYKVKKEKGFFGYPVKSIVIRFEV